MYDTTANQRSKPSFLLSSKPFDQVSVLGSEQETWLQSEIQNSTAEYTIIGSGSNVIAEDRVLEESLLLKSREIVLTTKNSKTSIFFYKFL